MSLFYSSLSYSFTIDIGALEVSGKGAQQAEQVLVTAPIRLTKDVANGTDILFLRVSQGFGDHIVKTVTLLDSSGAIAIEKFSDAGNRPSTNITLQPAASEGVISNTPSGIVFGIGTTSFATGTIKVHMAGSYTAGTPYLLFGPNPDAAGNKVFEDRKYTGRGVTDVMVPFTLIP